MIVSNNSFLIHIVTKKTSGINGRNIDLRGMNYSFRFYYFDFQDLGFCGQRQRSARVSIISSCFEMDKTSKVMARK